MNAEFSRRRTRLIAASVMVCASLATSTVLAEGRDGGTGSGPGGRFENPGQTGQRNPGPGQPGRPGSQGSERSGRMGEFHGAPAHGPGPGSRAGETSETRGRPSADGHVGDQRSLDGNRRFDGDQGRRDHWSAHRYRRGPYFPPIGYGFGALYFGEILPPPFWTPDYQLLDYWEFGLYVPPPGFVWVRYGDTAVLIDRETGRVADIVYGVFF